MICATCLGGGCRFCEPEPWPLETWLDMGDKEIEQLVLDSLDELKRRGELNEKLERMWAL